MVAIIFNFRADRIFNINFPSFKCYIAEHGRCFRTELEYIVIFFFSTVIFSGF